MIPISQTLNDSPSSDGVTPPPRLIAAPFTPFDESGAVDLDRVPGMADWLHDRKVNGAFICGTTGEGPSLTTQERKNLAERWCQDRSGKLDIIVHVGHNSILDAEDLARHACEIGAGGIAAIGPCFFSAASLQGLTEYCRR